MQRENRGTEGETETDKERKTNSTNNSVQRAESRGRKRGKEQEENGVERLRVNMGSEWREGEQKPESIGEQGSVSVGLSSVYMWKYSVSVAASQGI